MSRRFLHPLRKVLFAAALLCLTLLTACSEAEQFFIEGRISGANAQTVTLTYFAGGGLKTVTTSATGGSFHFTGRSATPTLALLTVAPENVRIATLVAKNGNALFVEADLNDPFATTVKGNSDSETVAKWIKEHSAVLKKRNADEINKAIADYVTKNTGSLASTALLTGFFLHEGFESKADSLYSLLDLSVRTTEMTQAFNSVISTYLSRQAQEKIPFLTLYERCDSLIHINPLRHSATLMCILDENKQARDSVVPVLRQLTSRYDSRLIAFELSTAPDSAQWRASLGRDSVAWPQTWVQGSVSASPLRNLNIPRIPYYIVADSIGRTIYRGSSISLARKTIEEKLGETKTLKIDTTRTI